MPGHAMNDRKISPVNTVSTQDVLLALYRRKWLYLLLIVVAGVFTFWFLRYNLFTYSSTATFFLNSESQAGNSSSQSEFRIPDILKSGEQYDRAYQLINSSAMTDHLIKKFNLVSHYGIDTSAEFYYEKAIAVLNNRISIKTSPFKLIQVSVSDAHRYLAADIANEIVRYLNELNRKILVASMKQKLQLYENLLKNTQEDNLRRADLFSRQLEELNKLLGRLERQAETHTGLLDLHSRLNQLISSMERSNEDLSRLKISYSLALQSIESNNLPAINIVTLARPSHRSLGWQSLTISAIVSFLVFTGIIYSIYIKLRYKNYFRVLMSNNKNNGEVEVRHQESV